MDCRVIYKFEIAKNCCFEQSSKTAAFREGRKGSDKENR